MYRSNDLCSYERERDQNTKYVTYTLHICMYVYIYMCVYTYMSPAAFLGGDSQGQEVYVCTYIYIYMYKITNTVHMRWVVR